VLVWKRVEVEVEVEVETELGWYKSRDNVSAVTTVYE